ncbi:ArsR/SmtB family transcription factor [Halorubrum distributum]|uniref:ArsR family transcriptional regulator n=3 Tax=Halorubrum distributum TaxID=29283 RepID=M0PU12_9EURY|nr:MULTISPECIES: ArsR family transcriptional regulator [Halorubrum distributum group]PHQ47281.1 transcriptional regulator [Halorubrum sp. C3]ELZ38645.1 ArsR family transcriptional regulator [Halorubrum terrestre JCM 10247]EMA72360.1 ArsR family transcriptional regulator [Halorubrum arcis JCM 13916]MYL17465.1 winged helix DNA-binding protein [Halorubrum terrestre]MYL67208.1 winged helix DNA-binding protein [Halorubrum terrestre]
MTDISSDSPAETDLDALIDDATTALDVKALSAFGYETRYRLVRLLVEADGAVRFDEITPYVSISDSAVSHALTLLCDAGLVEKQKDGRSRNYSSTERAEAIVEALDRTR